ncbi:amidase [Streptomyces camponoticapitis]|uniref:Amidase n=1 Tax=Streptomyces camponoticapitis TaxID=1616125 RepID=A0ABQ2EMJ0_9ACTN|nr:amidase [Streptomyces camponoticapitis]GGK16969.1 amidase [Streptomyces camponoticapitis]
MSNTDDDVYRTAAEQAELLDRRDVSAVELAEQAINRIERLDGEINAVVVRDFDRALAAARAADAARGRGERGPLLGIPVTVKESFNVAGLPTTWGIPPFADFVPAEDAVAVHRLKVAGAVVLGKTNVPVGLGDLQTYNPIYGTTSNPWDPTRTPGGSSGGSAAALAVGFGTVSIGSDIAGSLRVPAHFTGVYAHKSTFGLLPSRGHVAPPSLPLDYSRDLSVIGPMARGARDLAVVFNVLSGVDVDSGHRQVMSDLATCRVLVLDDHPLIPTSGEVRAALAELAKGLRTDGVRVSRHSDLLPDQVEAARVYMRLLLASIASSYPPAAYEEARIRATGVDPGDTGLAAERARGAALSYRAWIETDAVRARHREEWSRLFSEFDFVLCPPSPTTTFPHDHSADQWSRTISIDGGTYSYPDQLVWSGIASAPGLPATIAPIARSRDGLPIGVQIIGPLRQDLSCIRFAELLEQRYGSFEPPPLN